MGELASTSSSREKADSAGLFSHDAQDDVQVSATFPESNPFGRTFQSSLGFHLVISYDQKLIFM